MAFDVSKRIEELTERQKELVLSKHELLEHLDRAKAVKDRLRQVEKEIAWIAGALDALKVWNEEKPEDEKKANTAGWGQG